MDMLYKHFIDPCKRFPVSVLCTLAFLVTLLIDVSYDDRDKQARLLGFFLSSGFSFISLSLIAEHMRLSVVKFLAIGSGIALVLFLAFLTTSNVPVSFMMLGGAAFLSLFTTAVARPKSTEMDIWNFSYTVSKHIAFTFLLSAILFGGMIAIFKSIDFLFGIEFYSDIYKHIWFFMATVFPAVFAMSGIPNIDEYTEEPCIEGLTQKVINFLVLPLFFIYTLIWYGYFAKIVFTWSMPQGEVSHMALAFGGAGVFAYLVVYPISEQFKLIALFKKYFFMLLIAPCVLLSLAIFVRVFEYGITESRYFVLLGLFWFVGLVALSFVNFNGKSLRVILVSCATLLVIASVGPWSAPNVAEWSQLTRLKTLLVQHDLFKDGAVQPIQDQGTRPTLDEASEMESILRYLIRSQKTETLLTWFADIPNTKEHIEHHRSHKASQDILKEIGIANVPKNGNYRQKSIQTYGKMYGTQGDLFNVKGFYYYFHYQQGHIGTTPKSYRQFNNGDVSVKISFKNETLYVSIFDKEKEIVTSAPFNMVKAIEGHLPSDAVLFERTYEKDNIIIKLRALGVKLEKKNGKKHVRGFNGQILFRY